MKIYRRGKTWYVDYTDAEGYRRRMSTGTKDYDKARTKARRMVKGHEVGHTLRDTLDDAWNNHYVTMKSARTVKGQLDAWDQTVGTEKLYNIDTPWVMDQSRRMAKSGMTGPTINRYMAVLSHCLRQAVMKGWMDSMPMVPYLKENPGNTRTITKAEHQLMCNHWNEVQDYYYMIPLTIFLLETGCRLSEALAITQQDKTTALAEGTLTLWETKANKPRTVPLTNKAQCALRESSWCRGVDSHIQRAWSWARFRIDMQGEPGFGIHMLRHTCASRMVNKGVALSVIRDWLGHSSIKTTERYAHLDTQSLQSAVDVLNKD